jgi:hypothetical protein
MNELTADCFESLCAEAPVSAQLSQLDENRSAALRRFWLFLLVGLVLGPLSAWMLMRADWPTAGIIVGALLLIVPIVVGSTFLAAAGHALKIPVLERIAARGGMEYMANGFSPPVYPEARKALFGSWLSTEAFTDLFHGKDEEGKGYAVYEAVLQRRQGKSTQTVFSGQIYAFQRRRPASGETVIVPDRGLFNFFKPAGGMERVEIDDTDEAFEKKFEAYSTEPMEARTLLLDPELRRLLLDLREGGRTFLWLGGEDAMVAATGKNRFEAGSMFRSTAGRDRVRAMLDDACTAFATLRKLKAKLG